MTDQSPRSQTRPRPRVRVVALLAVVIVLAAAALAPAVLGGGGTVVVTTIPGGGWIQSPDNTAGGSTELVEGPGPGTLGLGSLAMTVAANTDFAGVAHPFLPLGIPFSDLTAGGWRTFVTGATGMDEEAASLRLSGYQLGTSVFTTLVVDPWRNGTVTPNVWQDTRSEMRPWSGRPTSRTASAPWRIPAHSRSSKRNTRLGDFRPFRSQSAPGGAIRRSRATPTACR